MKRYLAVIFVLMCVGSFAVFGSPVRAQGPIEGAQQTLWAATREMQNTRDARDAEVSAQRATAVRLTVVAAEDRATANAVSARETSVARTATAQAQQTAQSVANANATATAQANATETVRARQSATAQANGTATAQARQSATVQAQETLIAQATATAIAFAQIADERREQNQAREHLARLILEIIAAFALVAIVAVLIVEQVRRWRATPRVTEVIVPSKSPAAQTPTDSSAEQIVDAQPSAPLQTRVMVIDEELAIDFEKILERKNVPTDSNLDE